MRDLTEVDITLTTVVLLIDKPRFPLQHVHHFLYGTVLYTMGSIP